jgi:hypothetical protein
MSVDIRPAWMTPIIYNDEPNIPARIADVEDDPIDYSRKADTGAVFGDDLDDDEGDEEGGVDQ